MGTVQWSNLPADALSILSKILNTDVDTLRIRSVCSNWRSSVTPRRKPFPFPIKVPSLLPIDLNGDYFLNESTVYRLSHCTDDDSSKDWLFKVSETTKPNTFTLLNPLTSQKMDTPIEQLNLVDYRVYEICKSYTIDFIGGGCMHLIAADFIKVIPLWNFVKDCEFALLVSLCDGSLLFWKFGDEYWVSLLKGVRVSDVILHDNKCYSIDDNGVVISLDSDLNPVTVVASPMVEYLFVREIYLVKCRSNLYLVTESAFCSDTYVETESTLRVSKLNECSGKWDSVTELLDVVFILSHKGSLTIPAKDFKGFDTNRVYLNGTSYALQFEGQGPFTCMVGVSDDSDEFAQMVRPPTCLSA